MQKNTGVFIQTRAEMALELVWWLFLPTSQAWELHQCLRPDREVLEELRERKLGPHCVCDGSQTQQLQSAAAKNQTEIKVSREASNGHDSTHVGSVDGCCMFLVDQYVLGVDGKPLLLGQLA